MSPAASTRKRLDQAMFDDQLTESREKAKRLIMAGKVRVNDQVARKPSDQVKPEDRIEVEEPEGFEFNFGGHGGGGHGGGRWGGANGA